MICSHLIVQWQTQKITLLVHLALNTLGLPGATKFSHLLFPYPPKPTAFYCTPLCVLPRYHWTFFFVGRESSSYFCCCCCFSFGLVFVQIEVCRHYAKQVLFGSFFQQYLLISCFCVTVVIGIISQILCRKKKKIIHFRLKS